VAVTTSLAQPLGDLAVNVGGTLTLLEAIRGCATPPSLVFTSTNKVYGALDDVALEAGPARYAPPAASLYRAGIDERRPLDFHSPYGCSKGAADQYVLDYARSYGLDTVVFRMSCIYGPHQYGTEDQGWVAHFLLRALAGTPITIYGDGRQVRDILYVDDLVDALLLAESGIDRLRGQAFNIGGGPENAVSLLDLLDRIAALGGGRPQTVFGGWRTGDQRYYVSNTGKFAAATGWRPRVSAGDGIGRLHAWLRDNRIAPASPWRVEPVPATGGPHGARRRAPQAEPLSAP
jgi:CDP-paratose 2-epimerase